MSDYVTDEMAEAAARALHAETCCPCDPDVDDQMCTECGKGNPYA